MNTVKKKTRSDEDFHESNYLSKRPNPKNKFIFQEMLKFLETVTDENPRGIVHEELGEMVFNLVHNLSTKRNYRKYHFREDMVSEAVLTCLHYAKNFNPQKSNNPFAYFTQIAKNCFSKMISDEDRHSYIGLGINPSKTLVGQTITQQSKNDPKNYLNYPHLTSTHLKVIREIEEERLMKSQNKQIYEKNEVRNKRQKKVPVKPKESVSKDKYKLIFG